MGSRILFYLIIKPLSLLPLSVTYTISDFLAWLAKYGLAYRQKVVNENLRNAFPEKNPMEKARISTQFYAHFYDLLFESIRLFSMSGKEAQERFKVRNPELVNQLFDSGKSLILTGGHYQNWELFAVATAPQIKHTLLGIYTPLTNAFMEQQFARTRTQLGLVLVPKKKTADYFDQFRDTPTITTFAIDQSPRKDQKAYWTSFLGLPTATHFGAELYAKKYDYPVIFGTAKKIKRGYYELTFEMLVDNPKSTVEGTIIQKATSRLEQQIEKAPQYWLWTHKRWKLTQRN